MKKTGRTILAFDDRQVDYIKQLRKAFASMTGEQSELSNKEMFLIAMGVGFFAKNKMSDFKRSNTGPRIEYFNAKDNVLFASLQVAETGEAKSLLEIEALYNLAELYAAGGVSILWNYLQSERDFGFWFAGFMQEPLKMVRSN
jgi:hypothetical protein